MPNLDIAPNLEAWRLFRRLLVRVNPKVQEVDLEQIITGSVVQNLETSGFLPEMRKKFPVNSTDKGELSCTADKRC